MNIGQKLLYRLKKMSLSWLNRQVKQLQNRGQYQQALELAKEVRELTRRSFGEDHPSFATSLNNLGAIYQLLGQYTKAEQCFRQVVEIDRADLDPSFGLGMSLNNLASLYQAKGRYIEAEELFLEAKQILRSSLDKLTIEKQEKKGDRWSNEVLLPTIEQYIAQNLNNLGLLYQTLGDYQQAQSYHNRALEMKRTNIGENHPSFAVSLNNLALLRYETGNYSTAESLYQQSIKVLHKKVGMKHPHYLNSLYSLAQLYREIGNYSEAEKLLQQVLDTRQAVLGSNHPEVAQSLKNFGELLQIIGNYPEAEKLYQQANAIYQITLGEENLEFTGNLQNLATLFQITGRYSSAKFYYQRANDLLIRILGENHWQVAQGLGNEALFYQVRGNYPEAELHYRHALAILHRTLGENHPKVAITLGNLATLYQAMGDYVEAERLLLQANDIIFNVFGETHLSFVKNLNNLVHLYIEKGNFNEPELERILIQTKEIQSELLGEQHLDLAITLNNLGMLYKIKGDYTKAKLFVEQSLEIRRKVLGENHSDFATCIGNLAALSQDNGDYSKAKSFWHQALEIKKTTLGEYHPDISNLLNNLAILYVALGDKTKAFSAMEKAIDIDNRTLKQVFSISSDRQRSKYLQILQVNFSVFLSLVSQHLSQSNEAVEAAFDLVLRRKALATEAATIQRTTIFSKRYPQLAPQIEKMEEVANQISQLTFDVPSSSEQLATYQERLATLYRKQDELERDLSRLIPEINLQKRLDFADRRAVALALPSKTALIEFVRFNAINLSAVPAQGDSRYGELHYLAFILSANQPEKIQMVNLGKAEPIDRLIRAFRNDISSSDERKITAVYDSDFDDSETSEATKPDPKIDKFFETHVVLRQKIFDPLQSHLEKQLFISADGELNYLPFGLLPTNEGKYLMEQYDVSYLSVGRDLVRFFSEGKIKEKKFNGVKPTESLVVANPDYNLQQKQQEKSNFILSTSQSLLQTSNSQSLILDQELSAVREKPLFIPLPSSQVEGEKIATLLGVKAYTDAEALKSRVRKCQSPLVLHLSTHGYFLKDTEQISPELFFSQFIEDKRLNIAAHYNQHIRSGLAFAGVNTMLKGGLLPEEAEDGLLTSQDAGNMNLVGTELVVTSACDTALGDIQIGEGVAGLRRAFMLAGAQTMIMSLWSVPDLATAILMERFYRYLLHDKLGRRESLTKAQFDVQNLTIGKLRSDWLTSEIIDNSEYLKSLSSKDDDFCPFKHPSHWGAFICIGNPTPLNLSDN